MTDYLNEFTPDWPHGHVMVPCEDTVHPFIVKVTDWPGKYPILGYIVDADNEPWFFRADGDNGLGDIHLRNVAPPKHRAEDTK